MELNPAYAPEVTVVRGVEDETERAMTAAGALVLQLRREAGYSIGALAAEANLSPGLLSQIERGQGNPSLTTLIKLSQALKVPVGRFFHTTDQGGALVKRDARRRLEVAEDNLVYELLTPNMQGQLGVLRAQIAAGWDNRDAPFQHAGEECVTVLQGRLYVCVNRVGYELDEGDSLTYDSSLPHWYRNSTTTDAVLIGAMTPPSF
ncbi:helix-turn-helix transcriptional regulator [Paenarthrobacter sp. Z7-10]|uniref:helix-turn-helix domain-containing protein n=1 Tax=Paenarthrobacter sp. Z7-10 TaxID=2787635 RepID=UPI0022A9E204|nr:XRE family transcriptional regulator [Paenarthrobacter sp. Z7-10]MCZ2404470.1 helix-turn-helix transcriptional regulator [Paenarthrobacter sp. Z7-10]